MSKRIFSHSRIFLILTFFICLSCTVKTNNLPRNLYFFYMESCPGCDGYRTGQDITGLIKGYLKNHKETNGASYNLLTAPNSQEIMYDILEEENIKFIPSHFPFLILDHKVIYDYENIEKKIIELLQM